MKSLRTKITFITIVIVAIAVTIVSSISVFFIRNNEHRKSDQLLLVLSETGKNNLDYYFSSVQKSVGKVSSYANSNISGLDDVNLNKHIEDMKTYFELVASKTNGVLTYYYRIDPEVSTNVKGFWFTDINGTGFEEHEVTDITQYDTTDTSKLVWFTIPKNLKKAIWIHPYITDNLDKRVISYNEPIFYRGNFIGVIGIEIDYSTMAEQVNSIKLFSNGYAFLSDDNGNIFYHPKIDITKINPDEKLDVPEGLTSDSTFISYEYDGIKKEAAWLPLANGMRINVTVPVSEMEGDWQKLVLNIVIVSLEVLLVATLVILLYSRRISRPLRELILAAEKFDNGDFNYSLKYDKNDELGKLTKTFINLSSHMKENINRLNKQAFVDSMTQVKNKAAFSDYSAKLQARVDNGNCIRYAVGIFDCNDLKKINDEYGHDKGDIYLKTASRTIKIVFQNHQVFRIGGDEFAIILQNEDCDNIDSLVKTFENFVIRINDEALNVWEKVNIAYGITEYDPENDRDIDEVIRRADKYMYDDKRKRKNIDQINNSNGELI